MNAHLPAGVGLWAGFLDRLRATAAVAAVREIESHGIGTIWLQEYSGVDPFVRAALYLGATEQLTVALGVATIYGRDPEAMVAAASTLEEAFPGRFALGLGVSHRQLVEKRGGEYRSPLTAMSDYLAAMDAAVGSRVLPARFLGALGPKMIELAVTSTNGLHTYFCPVAHTAEVRDAIGSGPWLAPTQLVVVGAANGDWREHARPYLGLCLGLPNYRRALARFAFSEADLDAAPDELVEALAVDDEPERLTARIEQHVSAGANHVVVQLVPPPSAESVLARLGDLSATLQG